MFSFFNTPFKVEPHYTANQIVDHLELNKNDGTQLVNHFDKDYQTRHHNTYLLQAIAWNRRHAALELIKLDKEKSSLNLKDDWPTCRNTPIILSAKINDTIILRQLILAGVNVNEQDYRGYTALHYACIYRNEEAIKQLLKAGAKLQLTDAFGKTPYDYYCMNMSEKDLRYRYGSSGHFLNHVPDANNHYFSTNKKCLSALRWYIAHLIVNNNIGMTDKIYSKSLYELAKHQLSVREPVNDIHIYNAMMKCFLDNRPQLNSQLSAQLMPKVNSNYSFDDIDRFRLDPCDLVPRSAIYHDQNEIRIELQQLQNSGYRY